MGFPITQDVAALIPMLTLFVSSRETIVCHSIFQYFRLACKIIVVCLGQTVNKTYHKGKSNYNNYHILFIIGDMPELSF